MPRHLVTRGSRAGRVRARAGNPRSTAARGAAMDSEESILRWLEPDESGASPLGTRASDLNLAKPSWFSSRLRRLLPSPRRLTASSLPSSCALLLARTAASLLSRTLTDPVLTGIPFVDAHGAMRAGQLVEVCGVGGSGKTEILMQAAVNCALPREREGVRFGGCESSVLLLDLDGKFDTLRLLKILTARVEAALARETARREASDRQTSALARLSDAVYRESVGRFQMVRCHNSLDFLKALAVVDKIFEQREARGARADSSPDATAAPPRRLLLVDNVAAFYWLDRASRREHDAPLSLRNVHHASAGALMEISRRCRAPVVATKAVAATSHALSRDAGDAADAADADAAARVARRPDATHKDFLPPTWTSSVTQRLVLEPEPPSVASRDRDESGDAHEREQPDRARFQGRGGFGTSFVARWELPAGRPSARYRVDGEAGIRTVA